MFLPPRASILCLSSGFPPSSSPLRGAPLRLASPRYISFIRRRFPFLSRLAHNPATIKGRYGRSHPGPRPDAGAFASDKNGPGWIPFSRSFSGDKSLFPEIVFLAFYTVLTSLLFSPLQYSYFYHGSHPPPLLPDLELFPVWSKEWIRPVTIMVDFKKSFSCLGTNYRRRAIDRYDKGIKIQRQCQQQ